jgi:hypothetical protein
MKSIKDKAIEWYCPKCKKSKYCKNAEKLNTLRTVYTNWIGTYVFCEKLDKMIY